MQFCFAYHHTIHCQWCSVYIQTDRNSGRSQLCCCSCDHTHQSDPYTHQHLHKTHTLQSKQNASVIAHLAAIKMKSSHIFNTSCTSGPDNNSGSRNTHPKRLIALSYWSTYLYLYACIFITHLDGTISCWPVSPQGYGFEWYWTMPPLLTVLKCGAHAVSLTMD